MKTKKVYKPVTEAQHQKMVIDWSMQPSIREKYPDLKLLHHIPNGGNRDPIEAKHLKEQGVKPGIPDLFLPAPIGPYHGLYIEMKKPDGTLSSDQEWWISELSKQGYYCDACYTWESAVKTIEHYLYLDS